MRTITVIALVLGCYSGHSIAQGVGSQAALWGQKGRQERISYLEGLCEGLKAAELPSANLTCFDVLREQANSRQVFRFCGAVNSDDGRNATAFLDEFYRDKRHSDIPVSAAAVAFNDRACRERNSEGKLEVIQARGKCMRQLMALHELKVSQTVMDAHFKQCKETQ